MHTETAFQAEWHPKKEDRTGNCRSEARMETSHCITYVHIVIALTESRTSDLEFSGQPTLTSRMSSLLNPLLLQNFHSVK